jgi:hypothetical protein
MRIFKLGDQSAIDTLTTKGRLNNGKELDYALGIGIHNHNGWREFSHGGSDAGYQTFVTVYPDARLGVIIFANEEDFDANGVAKKITDLFLKNTDNKTPKPKDTTAPGLTAPDLAALRPYLGSYLGPRGIHLDLKLKNDRLYFDADDDQALLIKDSTNRYVLFDEREVQFTLGPLTKDTVVDVKAPDEEFHLTKYTPLNEKDQQLLQTYVGDYSCPELGCSYGIAIKNDHLVLTNNKYEDARLQTAGPDHLLSKKWWINCLTIKRNTAHQVIGFELDGDRVTHLVFNKTN